MWSFGRWDANESFPGLKCRPKFSLVRAYAPILPIVAILAILKQLWSETMEANLLFDVRSGREIHVHAMLLPSRAMMHEVVSTFTHEAT